MESNFFKGPNTGLDFFIYVFKGDPGKQPVYVNFRNVNKKFLVLQIRSWAWTTLFCFDSFLFSNHLVTVKGSIQLVMTFNILS